MTDAFICDAVRTPIGRYGGALAACPRPTTWPRSRIGALMARNRGVDWARVDDVILGCANQAGEDNRNVARMAALLAGLPVDVPGATVNRLCGSGLDAVGAGGAGHPVGRRATHDRRRRREHDPRAVRHAARRTARFRRAARDLRHHDRLALRQPADEGAVRHRLDAARRRRTSRERASASAAPTRTPSPLRSQRRAGRRAGGGPLRRRDRAGRRCPRAKGEPDRRRQRRASAPETTLEALAAHAAISARAAR